MIGLKKLLLTLLLAGALLLFSVGVALASHGGTPGDAQECNGLEEAAGQVGGDFADYVDGICN